MDFDRGGDQRDVKLDARYRKFVLDDKGYKDTIPHSG